MSIPQAKLFHPACEKLVLSATLGNDQSRQRQTMPQVDEGASFELSDTDHSGSLKDAEGKDNHSLDKEEGVVTGSKVRAY